MVADRARLKTNGSRSPQIAAVVVGRNDDYMPDFAARLRATIAWNIRFFVSEVVFVEWNPPADRELLSPQLAEQFPSLRAYVVAPEIHAAICENSRVQLLEYHAKNVGVRRTLAPWIMATNADAALGLDAIRTVLRGNLSEDQIWTAERVDIPWRDGQQSRISLRDTLRYTRIIPYHPLGTGDFILASRKVWERARGYDESLVKHRIGCDVRGTAQMIAQGACTSKVGFVLHLEHPSSCVEGIQPHHGEHASPEGVPYLNPESWGLADHREIQISERVWRLEP